MWKIKRRLVRKGKTVLNKRKPNQIKGKKLKKKVRKKKLLNNPSREVQRKKTNL